MAEVEVEEEERKNVQSVNARVLAEQGSKGGLTDLEIIVQQQLHDVIDAGLVPADPKAWCAAARQRLRGLDQQHPGYIARAANGIRARAQGRRVTGWRWVRGTHSGDYIEDPTGTDVPPAGYARRRAA